MALFLLVIGRPAQSRGAPRAVSEVVRKPTFVFLIRLPERSPIAGCVARREVGRTSASQTGEPPVRPVQADWGDLYVQQSGVREARVILRLAHVSLMGLREARLARHVRLAQRVRNAGRRRLAACHDLVGRVERRCGSLGVGGLPQVPAARRCRSHERERLESLARLRCCAASPPPQKTPQILSQRSVTLVLEVGTESLARP